MSIESNFLVKVFNNLLYIHYSCIALEKLAKIQIFDGCCQSETVLS